MKYSGKIKAQQDRSSGFTLAELLVSMTVLSVLLLMLTQLLTQVQKTWTYSEARISQFREARVAFDIITKNLSQATLHTYLDYERNSSNQVTNYKRQSELHFITMPASDLSGSNRPTHAIFFQAPLGKSDLYENLDNLFNARGYYVEYGDDRLLKPSFIQSDPKYRFRLMEYLAPAEENQIYIDGDEERLASSKGLAVYDKWFKHNLSEFSHPLAENVIALVVSPRESLPVSGSKLATYSAIAPDYSYDSNNVNPLYVQQAPPLVKVTMVAIDENSAIRLEEESGSASSMPTLIPANLFKSTASYNDDIEDLKEELNDKRVNFKIFSTIVAIRSSKWSTTVAAGGP